jgi:hypothetical protein
MIVGEVSFWDLGRNKANGKFGVISIDEDEFNLKMFKEFSKHLRSDDISFSDGKIFAGFRKVGEFKVDFNDLEGKKVKK